MGISLWQLLIVLVIVLLLFGTKKLKNIGSDLGGAVRGFKSAVKDGGEEADDALLEADGDQIMDGDVVDKSADGVAEKQHERA